jgi:hypothetical protein
VSRKRNLERRENINKERRKKPSTNDLEDFTRAAVKETKSASEAVDDAYKALLEDNTEDNRTALETALTAE